MTNVRIVHLAVMGFGINAAISSGKYGNLPPREIKDKIEDGSIFHFLKHDLSVDLSTFTASTESEIVEHWRNLNNTTMPEDFGAAENGLCLLIAYILEDFQHYSAYFK